MIRHVLSSIQFGLAAEAYRKKQDDAARRHLDRYFAIARRPRPSAVALDATVMIREMRSKLANERFKEAVALLAEFPDSEDKKYILEYCYYYICLYRNVIARQKGEVCDYHRLTALESSASSFIKKVLPLRWPDTEKTVG